LVQQLLYFGKEFVTGFVVLNTLKELSLTLLIAPNGTVKSAGLG
jgi:hypothetical protein